MKTIKKYFWKKLENGLLLDFGEFYDYKDRPEDLNNQNPNYDDGGYLKPSSFFAGFDTEEEAVARLMEIKKEYLSDELMVAVLVPHYIIP